MDINSYKSHGKVLAAVETLLKNLPSEGFDQKLIVLEEQGYRLLS